MRAMVKLWIPVSLAVLVTMAVVCIVDMRQRMHQLESRPRIDPAELLAVNTEIARLTVQIQTSTSALRDLAATRTHTAELDKRMSALQCELDSSEQSLEEQRQRLAQWDSMKDQIAPAAIDARIADLRRGVEDRWKGVDDLAQRALGVAQTAQGDFDHLSKGLQRDRERMWR